MTLSSSSRQISAAVVSIFCASLDNDNSQFYRPSTFVFRFAVFMMVKDKETVFITGACGFVGKFLLERLIHEGWVKLILNCRNQQESIEFKGHKCTDMDLGDERSIASFFQEYHPDHIIHLAALARIAEGEINPDEAFRINYLGTKKLIEHAVENDVKSFVFISTDLARNHQSVVGITKYLAEAFIQNLDSGSTQLVTLRLPNVSWTPGSVHLIFARQIKENKSITITHPEMSRRFISGDEAAEFILYAWEHGQNKDFLVVTKDPLKITELADHMITKSGKALTIEYIGIRQGEKLTEQGYHENEIEHTSMADLSLLKEVNFEETEVLKSLELLKSKPGFSINSIP